MQLIRISSLSLMFFFTFLQILFYEPIACYLPDTEAAPQGIIFSPLSQRVTSLMLGLKSLEQLHIGYLPCLPRAVYSGEESFLQWFKLAFWASLPPGDKRGTTVIYLNWGMSLSNCDQYTQAFRTYSKEVNFSGKSRHNPDFFESKTNAVENLQDLLKSKKMSLKREYSVSLSVVVILYLN